MKWMRKSAPWKDAAPGLYHIDSHECNDPQTHYLYTACRKEIKGHCWDITEDPPEHECCKDCWNKIKGVKS